MFTLYIQFIVVYGIIVSYVLFILNHKNDKIAYVPLEPVSNYVYIADLILELHVVWKTLLN